MIYVPSDNTYNKCYVVQSEGVIRGYDRVPTYNTTINYRDYFIESDYIFRDGVASFSNYSTLPTCLSNDIITNSYLYRTDLDKILVCFIIIVIFCLYFPYKIISRAFGRWLKL